MSIPSKASKAPLLFTMKTSGTGTGSIPVNYTTAVARQWKVKEILFERASNTDALNFTVYLYDRITTKKYILNATTGSTATTIRIAPTLSTGEYFVDQDAEIQVISGNITNAIPWTMRITGSLIA
jgi:hypothetical protein